MPTTLITGASGGLGADFARLAAADGNDIVLVARTADALESLANELRASHGITATTIVDDLSDPSSVDRVVALLGERGIEVDALVNNAGFGNLDLFAGTDPGTIRSMLRLNVEAATMLARAVLPGMLARKHGRVLNVASIAAFLPGPLLAVYYASKAYVLHWSLALSDETRGTGVTVTCLCPGPTKTSFASAAGMNESAMFKSRVTMGAAEVARVGYAAMKAGRPLVTAGWRNRLAVFSLRFAPRMLAARIARGLQESPARHA